MSSDPEITLESLGNMSADELRVAVSKLEMRLGDIHLDEHGRARTALGEDETRQSDEIMTLLRRAQAHQQIRQALGNPRAGSRAFPGAARGATSSGEPGEVLRMSRDSARDSALRMLESRAQHLKPEQQDQVEQLLRSRITEDNPNTDGSYIAKRTLITESDAYRSAFQQVLTEPHPIFTAEEAEAMRSLRSLDQEYRAMSEGTSSAGGYGVPVFLDPTITLTAQGSTNPFYRIARTVTITSNQWKGVSSAGVTWSWYTEGATTSDNSPTLAQPTVSAYMARGFVPFSIEVGQDYPNFASEIADLLASGYDELTAQAFVTGTGSNQPRGLVTALDANASSEVLLTTAGTLGAVDVNKAWEALPDRYKGNSRWLMGYQVADTVAGFGNGNNLSFVTVDLTNTLQTLRTRPVEYSSYMAALQNTSHTNVAVVGDFTNYLIAQRAGMSVELIPHLVDVTNNRPTGQRGFFAWARVGADSINDNGFRLINQT
jgi:HK97 family phage major capsid protein